MITTKLKNIFSYRINSRWIFNPFIKMQLCSLSDYPGVAESNTREVPIIVTLSSFRENYKNLPKTIYSLLNQSLKPDKIILWLDESSEDLVYLPYEITQFIKNGLEIRFIQDLGAYNKWYYTFKEYKNSIIVTADDGVFYQSSWLKKLYLSYIAHPNDIQVHKAHKVKLDLPYKKWEKNIDEEDADYGNFIESSGGVLYPPNCFSNEIFRKDIFLKNTPCNDSIWLWVMALVHNKKIRIVKNHIKTLIKTNYFSYLFNHILRNNSYASELDRELNNLLKYYKQNIYNKIK